MVVSEVERERAAVVDWCRRKAAELSIEQVSYDDWTHEWAFLREQIETFEEVADRIQRGEHIDANHD